jgi:hypothetical protein
MIEFLRLLLAALIDALGCRERLLLANLLLRQQLQVAVHNRHRPRLRAQDKALLATRPAASTGTGDGTSYWFGRDCPSPHQPRR